MCRASSGNNFQYLEASSLAAFHFNLSLACLLARSFARPRNRSPAACQAACRPVHLAGASAIGQPSSGPIGRARHIGAVRKTGVHSSSSSSVASRVARKPSRWAGLSGQNISSGHWRGANRVARGRIHEYYRGLATATAHHHWPSGRSCTNRPRAIRFWPDACVRAAANQIDSEQSRPARQATKAVGQSAG